MYICYKCLICHTVFIIPVEDVERMEKFGKKYISCNFGHKDIVLLNQYEDLKECMDNHVYKRDKGVIKQIK